MKTTPITRCANHECPNKPTEGTFTVTTINTREGRPRNITLTLCAPCADYLREAKDDAIKGALAESYVAKYPTLNKPPAVTVKSYRFYGGPAHNMRRLAPSYLKEFRVPVRERSFGFTMQQDEPTSTPSFAHETYSKMYWAQRPHAQMYVHSGSVKKMYSAGWRLA